MLTSQEELRFSIQKLALILIAPSAKTESYYLHHVLYIHRSRRFAAGAPPMSTGINCSPVVFPSISSLWGYFPSRVVQDSEEQAKIL